MWNVNSTGMHFSFSQFEILCAQDKKRDILTSFTIRELNIGKRKTGVSPLFSIKEEHEAGFTSQVCLHK
jgi:hypothetical protein